MKLSPFIIIFLATVSDYCLSQRINSRKDRIQEWIRTIREAPKGHSMSPSWTSKSRPRVIGVGALPLQNEADVSSYPSGAVSSFPSSSQKSKKPSFSLKKFKNPFSGLRESIRGKRYPQQPAPPPVAVTEDYSRPRETFRQNENSFSRYHEHEIERDALANYNPLNKQVAGVAIKEKRPPPTDYQRPPPTDYQRPNTEFQRPNTDFQRPNTEYQRPKADLIPPSSQNGFPSLSPFGSDEYNGNFGFTRPGLEKRPVLAVEQSQRPEFSEGQNLRPKRRRPISIFDQIPEVEQQPQRPEIIESQNLRPKRRPSVFDFDENSFGRNPVRFNTVEDNNSNSPRYQQIQNETPKRPYKPKFNFDSPEFTRAKRQKKVQNFNRNPVSFNTVEENPSNLPGYQQINENPTPAKFNFQDSQQFSRPNRQKNRNPVRFNTVSDNISNSPNYESPQKPTPAKFNFDYDSTVSSRQPFKNAPQKQPEFEYPSTFNHNKIYVRPAQQADLDFNLRPKRKRKSQNEGRFNEGRRFPFVAHDKPTNYVDFRARPRQPTRKRFDNLENISQVVRTTTPRPIPTPGPMDFPRPPPRRPRPPPTIPTHPPFITHPPSHYETVTQKLPVPAVDFSFNEVSDSKVKDYDYKEYDKADEFIDNYQTRLNANNAANKNKNKDNNQDQGFFAYPGAGSFPTLQQLGAGFESQKLARNKRSAPEDPLITSEARNRYRNRNVRNRRRLNNARDENRYRNRGSNNNNRNRDQPSRQGFGFENNFWTDGDANDFFSSSGFESTFGNLGGNRNTRANNYLNYEPEQVHYQQDRGHYPQEHQNSHSSYTPDPNSYNQDHYRDQNSYNQDHTAYNQDHNSYSQDHNSYNQDYYGQTRGSNRDPYTEQTIQSYPPQSQEKFYSDPYSAYPEVVNNEILGSGNFEVIKGGTFYDDDTYYYSTYNSRPQYGEQLFENFRDFADIKNDRYRDRYPKY